MGLGATKIFTLEDLQNKDKFLEIKSTIRDSPPRLALNCVSGTSVASFASLLGKDAHLVTYGSCLVYPPNILLIYDDKGAMSKQPMSLPSSAFIFKNMTAHGFMQGRWYRENSLEARENLLQELTSMMIEGKVRMSGTTARGMLTTCNSSKSRFTRY